MFFNNIIGPQRRLFVVKVEKNITNIQIYLTNFYARNFSNMPDLWLLAYRHANGQSCCFFGNISNLQYVIHDSCFSHHHTLPISMLLMWQIGPKKTYERLHTSCIISHAKKIDPLRPTHSHGRWRSLFSHMLSFRPSVRNHFSKQNIFQAKRMFTNGETVGLAEWIIDYHSFSFLFL